MALDVITTSQIRELQEVVSPDEWQELGIAFSAFKQGQLKYKNESGAQAGKDMLAAKELLNQTYFDLVARYLPERLPENEEVSSFSTPKKVHEYLVGEGWKISLSAFYEHVKEKRLRPRKGVYSLAAVVRYAKKNLKRADTGQKVNEKIDRLQEEKIELDVKAARIRVQREQHDLDVKLSRYVTREQHELALVGRAVAFMAHLNHTIQKNVPDWIDLVEGKQTRAPELVEALVGELEQRMSDFSVDADFEIIMEATVK